MPEKTTVLVAGATGYVGGRLIPRLVAAGYGVRAMARSKEKIASRPWANENNVTLVHADAGDLQALTEAAQGCDSAYYLIHSTIDRQGRFMATDRQLAENMKTAAERAGLRQIVYLGELGQPTDPQLNPYLMARLKVATILQSGSVPVTVLRAAMILGSGNAWFEVLRYLVERLPWMLMPKWTDTPTQPIAISNVLGYLIGCLYKEETYGQSFDIGGPEILTFKELIRLFAQAADLPARHMLQLPCAAPRLSARSIHWITPVPFTMALPLTLGFCAPTQCKENRIQTLIPQELLPCRAAIRRALERLSEDQVETSWSDAGALQPPEWSLSSDTQYAGGTIESCAYRLKIQAPVESVWKPVLTLGGSTGYYFGNRLWQIRGWMDRRSGGMGLHRGRRSPTQLRVGDALDFWRVMRMVPYRRLTLMAEMRVPGQAVFDIELTPIDSGTTELRIISRFRPKGLAGLIYWYALYPPHMWIFRGMLKAMAKQTGASAVGKPEWFDPDTTVDDRPTPKHRSKRPS